MATPYSQDLRDKVLAACDRGMATRQIAETFAVSRAWVRGIKQRRREHGETAPRRQGSPGVRKIDRDELAHLVAERPDATGPEWGEMLGVECSESAIYAALKKLGLSYQKKDDPRRRTGPPRCRPAAASTASNTVGTR